MDYRMLGGSGCAVSSLCLGTMTFGVETDAQPAIGIVGGVRVAGAVERGGLGGGQMQPGRAKVGLELADRTGAEDGAPGAEKRIFRPGDLI